LMVLGNGARASGVSGQAGGSRGPPRSVRIAALTSPSGALDPSAQAR
jgi:hypothetical protein